MNHLVPRIEFPEIVIGLVSPIGTPLNDTIEEFSKNFSEIGYKIHDLRVTNVFEAMKHIVTPEIELTSTPMKDRYRSYISYGNQLRQKANDPSLLAALSIQTIVENRIAKSDPSSERFSKNLYIF